MGFLHWGQGLFGLAASNERAAKTSRWSRQRVASVPHWLHGGAAYAIGAADAVIRVVMEPCGCSLHAAMVPGWHWRRLLLDPRVCHGRAISEPTSCCQASDVCCYGAGCMLPRAAMGLRWLIARSLPIASTRSLLPTAFDAKPDSPDGLHRASAVSCPVATPSDADHQRAGRKTPTTAPCCQS